MRRLFEWIIDRPKRIVCLGLLFALGFAIFLPTLQKDIRADAFLAKDSPALLYRDVVRERFGLTDPLVVALESSHAQGVYQTSTLALLQTLSDALIDLPGINPERVLSLATQNNIVYSDEGMDVVPFLEDIPDTPEGLAKLRAQLEDFPLFRGLLVSEDARVALIIAELEDDNEAEQVYQALLTRLRTIPVPEGVELHVAGEGAIFGYIAKYVDIDARQLVPLAGVIITLVLIFAYGRFGPALACNLIMFCAVAITVGLMAAQGVPFYLITNALPVILIGISVADGIHIYSTYFDMQMERDGSPRELLIETMLVMWRPVTLTTLTTMAGFLGLYYAAYMPPFQYFGLYAAIGVVVAWVYTLLLLPALMILTRPVPGRWYTGSGDKPSVFARFMGLLGRFTLNWYKPLLGVVALVIVAGGYAVTHLQVDENPVDVFHPDEPVAVADRLINAHTRGTSTLDIVIETENPGDLLDPERLARVAALQSYAESLPAVGGSLSVVDYLKQMHRAMNGGDRDFYALPDDAELAAQYFLLYEALSGPTDFEDDIDQDYQVANLRVQIKDGGYQALRRIVEPLEFYIETEFNREDMRATVSGRANLNYHWIDDLAKSHFLGLAVALVLVWSVSALLFRSESAGFYTLLPVAATVLGVYVAMVALDITLGMGTSMFAAIAIGLGIDFAIHSLEKLRVLARRHGKNDVAVLSAFYPSCGRALLYNCLAITAGFAVLMVSKISSLNNFGAIVMLSILTSFIASVTVLPALVIWRRPAFVYAQDSAGSRAAWRVPLVVSLVIGAAVLGVNHANAAESEAQLPVLEAQALVTNVNAVASGEQVSRKLRMTLTNKRGKQRVRETVVYRKNDGENQRSVLFFTSPANVRGTAFLVWDYAKDQGDDDQWLYLPAARKVRRISAADRGDYFLGTDFSYDDIKLDGKLEEQDFNFSTCAQVERNGKAFYCLEAVAKSDKIAKELGYRKVDMLINPSNWMVMHGEFWDVKNRPLRTLEVLEVAEVQGIPTRMKLSMGNRKTGHSTVLQFTEVDYDSEIDERLFTKSALERGL
ncbi:MAG: Patched family protein [Gammaproteobacteria bacterium]|nr:MAG: Patched family protein [Gammaproteobacteria bacterium]